MIRVDFFTKPDCCLCDAAWFVLERVRSRRPFDVRRVDITAPGNERWAESYTDHIPVVHINGVEVARHRLVEAAFEQALATAAAGAPS